MDILSLLKERNLCLVVRRVFSFLGEPEVEVCRRVSRSWRAMADEDAASGWGRERTERWKWARWRARAEELKHGCNAEKGEESRELQEVFLSGGWTFVVAVETHKMQDVVIVFDAEGRKLGEMKLQHTKDMVLGKASSNDDQHIHRQQVQQNLEEEEQQQQQQHQQQQQQEQQWEETTLTPAFLWRWKTYRVRWKYSQLIKVGHKIVVLGAALSWNGIRWWRRFADPREDLNLWVFDASDKNFNMLSSTALSSSDEEGILSSSLSYGDRVLWASTDTDFGRSEKVTVVEVDGGSKGVAATSRRCLTISGHDVSHSSLRLSAFSGRHLLYRQVLRDSLTTRHFALGLDDGVGSVGWSSEWHLPSAQASAFVGPGSVATATAAAGGSTSFKVTVTSLSSSRSVTVECPVPDGLRSGSHQHFSFRFDTPSTSLSAACFPVMASAHSNSGGDPDAGRDLLRRIVIVVDERWPDRVSAFLHPYGLSFVQLLSPSLVLAVDPGRERRWQACYVYRTAQEGEEGAVTKRELLSEVFSPTGGPRERLKVLAEGMEAAGKPSVVVGPNMVVTPKDSTTEGRPQVFRICFDLEE